MVSGRPIDFGPVNRKEATLADLAAGLAREDLATATDAMCELQLTLVAEALDEDVVFVPDDPAANDTFAADAAVVNLPWTLGHVVVHTTASSEEAAAQALTLARGLTFEGRSRYEVLWTEARTAAFLRQRLEESRRMRLAMLAAWPDEPHLETTYVNFAGVQLNAVGRFLSGLRHDDSHLDQIREIVRQAQAGREPAA